MFFELGKMSNHGHGQQVRHRFRNDPGKSLKVRFNIFNALKSIDSDSRLCEKK